MIRTDLIDVIAQLDQDVNLGYHLALDGKNRPHPVATKDTSCLSGVCIFSCVS